MYNAICKIIEGRNIWNKTKYGRCVSKRKIGGQPIMVISMKRDATLSICLEMLYNNTRLSEFDSCVSTTEIGFLGIEVHTER